MMYLRFATSDITKVVIFLEMLDEYGMKFLLIIKWQISWVHNFPYNERRPGTGNDRAKRATTKHFRQKCYFLLRILILHFCI